MGERSKTVQFVKAVSRTGKKQTGFTLIETTLVIGMLGCAGFTLLNSLAADSETPAITSEHSMASKLVHKQIEYLKGLAYQHGAAQYPVDPTLAIPSSWMVPPPTVQSLYVPDDGVQKVTVCAEHNGEAIFSITTYKTDEK